MYLILTASKDTYITNKIISNKFRATDANVGYAGTLDIFKLYAESTSGSSDTPKELSRALINFDLSPLVSLASSSLDLNSSTFEAKLKLYDILGGQATPSNFNLVVYPLSRSFDEGIGRDVASFGDLDSCNFITASYATGSTQLWAMSGANSTGLMGSRNIDVMTSGNLGSGIVDFGSSQKFPEGNEDLNVNVSTIISASLSNILHIEGFRISLSGSEETDQKSRFVKRFSSRHASNKLKVPQLHISWDDTIEDHHNDFIFDVSDAIAEPNTQASMSAPKCLSANKIILKFWRSASSKTVCAS